MSAIRWASGVLAALGRRGSTRSQLRRERDELKAQVASLQRVADRQFGLCGEVSEQSFVYRHELRRIAQQLRRWSDESHAGGWSTQQCQPMDALAAKIFQHIGAQTGASHKRMLLRVAEQLRRWSDESTTGGWSTHQVKPMRALAARIEAATKPPPCCGKCVVYPADTWDHCACGISPSCACPDRGAARRELDRRGRDNAVYASPPYWDGWPA